MTGARLTIEDVVVSFGGHRAVDEVSLDVAPGEVHGLIGPNGSGKTTLLDVVSGLLEPTVGRVRLDGVDLCDYRADDRAVVGVARSFQDARLYPELTVTDTLLVGEDARHAVGVFATTFSLPRARRSERSKRAAVDDVITAFGLGPFRDHRVSELSTGTRRVVDLAGVVLASPSVLLLDEPTAGVAQREAEAFAPLLQRMHEVTGATIVLVEHDVPMVFELCSHVTVLEAGRVVATGPNAAVRDDPRALAAYLGASDEAMRRTGRLDGGAGDGH